MSMMCPPPHWPKQVKLNYSPEKILGKGGFGCVYIAAEKSTPANKVAIKVVKDDGYAEREITILSELTRYSHPNIVKLLDNYAPQDGDDLHICMRCLVLSLARGPPLSHILKQRGALGFSIAQTISSQLVNAIAFLHGHGVIHRDIQPCNIIVSGTALDDDMWWADVFDKDGILESHVKRCHITLIDFGFARALSAEELDVDVEPKHKAGSSQVPREIAPRGRSPTRKNYDEFDQSVSRKRVRDVSALGTRNYVAPEVLRGVRKADNKFNVSAYYRDHMEQVDGSLQKRKKRCSSLSTTVSYYGMVADAFSVGATIRYMVTGVPPDYGVNDYIQAKKNPLKKAIRLLKRKKTHVTKRYRSYIDIPSNVIDLITRLTHYDDAMRMTVRMAMGNSWISEMLPESDGYNFSVLHHGESIEHLECTKDTP